MPVCGCMHVWFKCTSQHFSACVCDTRCLGPSAPSGVSVGPAVPTQRDTHTQRSTEALMVGNIGLSMRQADMLMSPDYDGISKVKECVERRALSVSMGTYVQSHYWIALTDQTLSPE